MGVQAIYQTIGPEVLGKTKVFYCLIYVLGIGKDSPSSNPETCSMHPKLVDGECPLDEELSCYGRKAWLKTILSNVCIEAHAACTF
jgi:hypothetical protein